MTGEVERLLGEVSTVLAASLDIHETLQRIARLCVPVLADQCIVDLIDDDSDAPLAMAHVDPRKEHLLQGMVRKHRPPAGAARHGVSPQRKVPPQLFPTVPDALLRAMARDEEHLRAIHALGPRSVIVVPLVARGNDLGAIMLVISESDRQYTQDDLHTAQELASRAALAVDNARLYREAREAIRLRDEVLAFVSHDLKAPLSSIKLHVEMLQELDGEVPHHDRLHRLARMDGLLNKMDRLIDELMDTAQLQLEQDLVLEYAPTDLVALAVHVVADQQAATECHTLSVETEHPELLGNWDAARLGRVLDNLVGNAVKYSPEGGSITVEVERDDDWAVLHVVDAGVGIPADEQERVFHRFFRARNVTGRFSGSGIGLAGVRHIVERHGGTIAIASVEGQGTTITVRLPLQGVSAAESTLDSVGQTER